MPGAPTPASQTGQVGQPAADDVSVPEVGEVLLGSSLRETVSGRVICGGSGSLEVEAAVVVGVEDMVAMGPWLQAPSARVATSNGTRTGRERLMIDHGNNGRVSGG